MEKISPDAQSRVEALAHTFEAAGRHTPDLSDFRLEDWVTIGFFWVMTTLVFLQFFTRYVLNDSYAWTEELAVYCLIAVVFIGSATCIRKDRHIQVNFLYRYLPAGVARALATLVDILRVASLGYVAFLVWRYIQMIGDERMTTINLPKNQIYWLAFAGFVLMVIHAIGVAVKNWRQGYSALEKPEAYDGTENQ